MAVPLIGSLVASVGSSVIGAVKNAVKPGTLGKDDFLKLLVAQLKNQNPLNPMSNDQFINQSAAFSSLEQLQNISKSIDTLASGGGTSALASASGLLGRPVRATAGQFTYNGTAASLPFTLDTGVSNAVLEVTDASGRVIAQQSLGAKAAGQYTAPFTGGGQALAAGSYRYRIVSVNADGTSTALPAVGGTVTGLSMVNGAPALAVGSITVGLADVSTIGTPTN
ncbi:MAG: flagellar hook assembly protein FlgD [Candidatus Rokubacteria bacterium]|nr:flagellar hook assembly protein FlgD [Candidatus Rokubacteria bacterium]